jgi:regulator of Ty1 transposition protein 103
MRRPFRSVLSETRRELRARLLRDQHLQYSSASMSIGLTVPNYRRQAEKTASIWLQRLKESPPNKKLNLIYLANEIVQQGKIRKKEEFLQAYSPIIADAVTSAYKGAPSDVQNKIRRVVEVWRQRQVFKQPVQEEVEHKIDGELLINDLQGLLQTEQWTELDRSRSVRKPALGGSLLGSSIPAELSSVGPQATALQKADVYARPVVATANEEYIKLTSPNFPIPTPPMHAAGLASLVKKLATAEGAVTESFKARNALIAGLEKLLESNRSKAAAEEAQLADLKTKKDAIDARKQEVEHAILKGLSAEETAAISSAPFPAAQRSPPPARPDIEELTPPPMESFTPVGSPKGDVPDDVFRDPSGTPIEPMAVSAPPSSSTFSAPATAIGGNVNASVADLLNTLQGGSRQDDANANGNYGQTTTSTPNFKKRKMSRSAAEDEFAAFAGDGDMAGIDADVGELI